MASKIPIEDIFIENRNSFGEYKYSLDIEKAKDYDILTIKENSKIYLIGYDNVHLRDSLYTSDDKEERMPILLKNYNLVVKGKTKDTTYHYFRSTVNLYRPPGVKKYVVFNEYKIRKKLRSREDNGGHIDNGIADVTDTYYDTDDVFLDYFKPTESDIKNKTENLEELKSLIENASIEPPGESRYPFSSLEYEDAKSRFEKNQKNGGKSKRKKNKRKKKQKRKTIKNNKNNKKQ